MAWSRAEWLHLFRAQCWAEVCRLFCFAPSCSARNVFVKVYCRHLILNVFLWRMTHDAQTHRHAHTVRTAQHKVKAQRQRGGICCGCYCCWHVVSCFGQIKMTANVPCKNCYKIWAENSQHAAENTWKTKQLGGRGDGTGGDRSVNVCGRVDAGTEPWRWDCDWETKVINHQLWWRFFAFFFVFSSFFFLIFFWCTSIRPGLAQHTHILAGVAKRLIKIKNDFIIYFSSDNRGAACFVFTSLFTSISACRCRSLFVSFLSALYTSWSWSPHPLPVSISAFHSPIRQHYVHFPRKAAK